MSDAESDLDGGAAAFEAARPKLMAIAYRMLGSVAEAEDVVGDVAVRWAGADREAVEVPEAWLVAVTSRRALDVLRSARLRREEYPGVWLPEPVATGDGPAELAERNESLTMGFLLLLERLTPIERAVLVLHDALGYGYGAVADALDRSEAACRQALHRARAHVTVPARRRAGNLTRAAAVTGRFLAAGAGGDVTELLATLSPEVVALADGGGIVHASMRPVRGPAAVGRFVSNLVARLGEVRTFPIELNGRPGVVVHGGGRWAATTVDVDAAGLVTAVYIVASPAKLERLVAAIPGAADLPGPWEGAGRFRHRRGRPVAPTDRVRPR